jgi:hypothetical protein
VFTCPVVMEMGPGVEVNVALRYGMCINNIFS